MLAYKKAAQFALPASCEIFIVVSISQITIFHPEIESAVATLSTMVKWMQVLILALVVSAVISLPNGYKDIEHFEEIDGSKFTMAASLW